MFNLIDDFFNLIVDLFNLIVDLFNLIVDEVTKASVRARRAVRMIHFLYAFCAYHLITFAILTLFFILSLICVSNFIYIIC